MTKLEKQQFARTIGRGVSAGVDAKLAPLREQLLMLVAEVANLKADRAELYAQLKALRRQLPQPPG